MRNSHFDKRRARKVCSQCGLVAKRVVCAEGTYYACPNHHVVSGKKLRGDAWRTA